MDHVIAFPVRTACIRACFLVYGLVLCGCAGQRPPEGGPVDVTPPEIISVYPAPNATGYADTKIALEFSKYVDRRSVEESIFISPYVKNIEFAWSGREVELRFREALRKNTTYVVTVGTDVVDVNNRNRMAHAFSIAFSTGSQIDHGSIQGRVYDDNAGGVMIFAYKLDGLKADTLNPMTLRPDYITQTGSAGDFSLTHLALGSYRAIALRDEFRNLLYDPETDAMSTAPQDIRISREDSIRTDLNFILSKEDTTAPRLVSATATDARHLDLKFSEFLDSASLTLRGFSIIDTTRRLPLAVSDEFIHYENPALVILVTDPQEKETLYKVTVTGVRDRVGHEINPLASSKQFSGSARPDTLPPLLIFATVMDSTMRHSVSERFRFDFSEPLQRQSAERNVTLRAKDSSEVPQSIIWNSGASFTIVPRQDLRPNSFYAFFIRFDSLRDDAGNHSKDSTRRFSFRTIDPEMTSSIEGTLTDEDTALVDRYVVVAQNSNDAMRSPARVTTRRGKKFIFDQLSEGEYRLRAFQDFDLTGEYNAGRPFPFLPAERFSVYRDSIKVRARWPVEGVLIKMK